MKSYDRSRLADQTLTQNLAARNARLCDEMADHLADVGEFEARRLHLPAGYSSTFQYCVHELHLTEQSASNASMWHARHAVSRRSFMPSRPGGCT